MLAAPNHRHDYLPGNFSDAGKGIQPPLTCKMTSPRRGRSHKNGRTSSRLAPRRALSAGGQHRQSFVTAIQSTSTSKGPVHSGTQKKMRAGGFFGKKRL